MFNEMADDMVCVINIFLKFPVYLFTKSIKIIINLKKKNFGFLKILKIRAASGPEISGNLEKSGNFEPLEKCQGKIREIREIGKSQGILLA